MMPRRRSKGPYHLVREAMKVMTTLLKTPSVTEKEHTFVLEAMTVMTTLLRTSSETGKDQQHTPRSRLRHSSPSPPPLVAPFALPLHRRIIPSSHRRILHAVPSSHRPIFASSYRRTPSTMPHRLIVPSSHLLIIPSSNTINNASSSHRLIDSPSHRLSFASSHRRTPSRMFHRLVDWSSGRVLCCVCVRAEGARVCVRARAALRNWQWRMRRICVVMGGGSGACGGRRLGLVARCGDRALEQINAFVYLLGIISPGGDVISSPAQGRSSGTT